LSPLEAVFYLKIILTPLWYWLNEQGFAATTLQKLAAGGQNPAMPTRFLPGCNHQV